MQTPTVRSVLVSVSVCDLCSCAVFQYLVVDRCHRFLMSYSLPDVAQ
jgi:hypothetical protein